MNLKPYTVRLDPVIYESLRSKLKETNDPDLTISFVLRRYLRHLDDNFDDIVSSELGVMNSLLAGFSDSSLSIVGGFPFSSSFVDMITTVATGDRKK